MYSCHGVPVPRTWPSSKLLFLMRSIFPVFPLSAGVAPCLSRLRQLSWLCAALGMDEVPRAAAHWAMAELPWAAGSITLTAWAVSTSSAARPALTQASKIQKHQAWATERKWGPSSRAAWLCAGVSPGLAAHWTGKTVRHRQAPPTRLHYKQKHPDRNFSQTVQTPAPEEYLRAAPVLGMALDWAVWHKWIANAQTKMPTMVLTLGARLFSPSCAHGSQAAADWGLYTPSLPPNL